MKFCSVNEFINSNFEWNINLFPAASVFPDTTNFFNRYFKVLFIYIFCIFCSAMTGYLCVTFCLLFCPVEQWRSEYQNHLNTGHFEAQISYDWYSNGLDRLNTRLQKEAILGFLPFEYHSCIQMLFEYLIIGQPESF